MARYSRTRFAILALLALLALMAATACGQAAPTATPAPAKPTAGAGSATAAAPTTAAPAPTTAASAATAPAAAAPTTPPGKTYVVAISQLVTHPSIEETKRGLKESLAQQGFVEGKNLKYIEENAQGEVANARNIAEKLDSDKPDVIVPLTTPNSQAVVKVIKDRPVVFGMITDPVQAGLVPSYKDASGTNVTGLYNLNPVEDQFDNFRAIAPKTKNIGIVYNAGEINSQVLVEKARQKAKEFNWTVAEASVANSNEVLSATQSLVGRADAIYIPQDNTVVSAFDAVMKVANDNKLPVFAGAPEQVQAGAIVTIAYSQYDQGVQLGKMVAAVLRGQDPGKMPPQTPDKKDLYVNKGAATKLGLTVPDDILKKAVKVYE